MFHNVIPAADELIGLEDHRVEARFEETAPFIQRSGKIAAVLSGEESRHARRRRHHQIEHVDMTARSDERPQMIEYAPRAGRVDVMKKTVDEHEVEAALRTSLVLQQVRLQEPTSVLSRRIVDVSAVDVDAEIIGVREHGRIGAWAAGDVEHTPDA